ncbi:IclR family transcriptional regulator [Primorskyibacter sedentarius]|uniref:IclR family transcriptional regulator n=1 Tax=Primorskyibacter sedentarius TaxID=745311 RepID=A0A4V2UM91_9RHOB|nr:IclR family transcriptional regulator C-terminal domain-containing protein [Primorskyibacter sedentarius]TCS55265.1 IclR family transcriptional regulator [Primorskyibacter sedentarius]
MAKHDDPVTASAESAPDLSANSLFVSSLAKGIKILECFDGGKTWLSLNEIDERANIGKSAAQRAVFTLHALGYIRKDEASKRYQISPKMLSLTRNFSSGHNVLEAGMAELLRFHEETGETVNIGERDGKELVCIARIPGRHVVTINVGVGWRFPIYATGPGLVLLAYEPEEVARRILESCDRVAYTKQTVTDLDELMDWLRQIRKDGFVIADQLLSDGEYSVAAPILGADGKILAACNASLPVSRWSLHDLNTKMVPGVCRTTRNISRVVSG